MCTIARLFGKKNKEVSYTAAQVCEILSYDDYEKKLNEQAVLWKQEHPLKYNQKDTFVHWTVLNRIQDVRIWHACGVVCTNDWTNLYTIVNLDTGEIMRNVSESFIDDLKIVSEKTSV